jgi:lipid-binding SYLF domain-containing protein
MIRAKLSKVIPHQCALSLLLRHPTNLVLHLVQVLNSPQREPTLKGITMHKLIFSLTITALMFVSACSNNPSKTPVEKRQVIIDMRNQVLQDLYKIKPDVKAQIGSAEGYAVFSNANINLIFASVGAGHGVVRDNKSGKNTFMKMGEAGVGLGIGVKDFRVVFVFHSRNALTQFVEDGWAFGVNADAAAKASEKGAAVGGEATFDNITVYQLTESGLALQATVKGTKFWQDSELN